MKRSHGFDSMFHLSLGEYTTDKLIGLIKPFHDYCCYMSFQHCLGWVGTFGISNPWVLFRKDFIHSHITTNFTYLNIPTCKASNLTNQCYSKETTETCQIVDYNKVIRYSPTDKVPALSGQCNVLFPGLTCAICTNKLF